MLVIAGMIQSRWHMIIGLTGSIATGKSTVTGYLLEKGYPVIDSDKLARTVVTLGHPVLEQIKKCFGDGVIMADGHLDRKALGSIIFKDAQARQKLNAITHPAINKEMTDQIAMYQKKGHKLIFCDVPLLYESHMESSFDAIWVVYVPEAVQKNRLITREGISQTEADEKIASQLSIEKKKEMADQVIMNDGSKEETYKNIEKLLKLIK